MREVRITKPGQLILVGIVVLYAIVLLGAPIVAIIGEALSRGAAALLKAIAEPDVLLALRLTLLVSLIAVIINMVMGVLLAWVLVRHCFPGKRLLDALVDLPFVFSPVIFGYALIVLFGRNGWIRGVSIVYAVPGVIVATLFVTLPFIVREIQPILANMTHEQEEAAYILGSSPLSMFWRVVLPQLRHALLYGVVLTVARAVGDFGAVAVAGGSIERETETATLYIFRAFNDRNPAGAYGVAILLCLLSLVTLIVLNFIRRLRSRESA